MTIEDAIQTESVANVMAAYAANYPTVYVAVAGSSPASGGITTSVQYQNATRAEQIAFAVSTLEGAGVSAASLDFTGVDATALREAAPLMDTYAQQRAISAADANSGFGGILNKIGSAITSAINPITILAAPFAVSMLTSAGAPSWFSNLLGTTPVSSVSSADLGAAYATMLESGSTVEEITSAFQAAGFTDAQVAAGLASYGTTVNAANVGTSISLGPSASVPPATSGTATTGPIATPAPLSPGWSSLIPVAGSAIHALVPGPTPGKDIFGRPIQTGAGMSTETILIALAVGAALLLT